MSKMPALLTRMSTPAPSLNHVLNRSLDGGCLGDVESDGDRLVAMACGGLLGMSQGNVGDRDPRAFSDIAFGDRRPDAARAASDERDFVLEFHVVSSLASVADCVLVACVPLKTCPTDSRTESIAPRAPRAPRARRRTRGHSSDCPTRSPKMWRNWRNASGSLRAGFAASCKRSQLGSFGAIGLPLSVSP